MKYSMCVYIYIALHYEVDTFNLQVTAKFLFEMQKNNVYLQNYIKLKRINFSNILQEFFRNILHLQYIN